MRFQTLTLVISGFPDKSTSDTKNLTKVKPNEVTRFAFDKAGYDKIQISNQIGPQNDGMLDVIDAIKLYADGVDIEGTDCALIVRVESTRGMDSYAAQKVGEAIEAYMARNGVTEFATVAIADINEGQELHGKWNTLLLVRAFNGAWTFKNLRFTSIQKSTDGDYAVLLDGKLAKTDGNSLVSTILDNNLGDILEGGYELDTKKAHLVRAPINHGGAYAVVGDGIQAIYRDDMTVMAYNQTNFITMPAIDVDGMPIDGKVTTVSGQGNDWDVRKAIPASQAGNLGQAYSASATA